jgi:hypothetical protein
VSYKSTYEKERKKERMKVRKKKERRENKEVGELLYMVSVMIKKCYLLGSCNAV